MGKELKNLDLMTLVTLALALCFSQQLVPGLPGGSVVKNPPANSKTHGFNPWLWEDPLEKEMKTHSSVLAWRIPWAEEPGGLQSMG